MVPQNSVQPDIAGKVAFLSNPEAYLEHAQSVDVVETHLSWVFLTATLVHKLKKPAARRLPDLSTLEARRINCEREVLLNRRLAPHVYLGLIPLTLEPGARLKIQGDGPVVDWMVKMRRLPANRMFDRLIKDRMVRDADVRKFTETMIRFHARCRRPSFGSSDYPRHLADTIRTHRNELRGYRDLLSGDVAADVAGTLLHYLDVDVRKFEDRVVAGRIVEGHGDLRPEHVCLEDPVSIFDCLEFSQELRTLDVADELAFLALECESLDGHDEAQSVLSLYADMSGDAIDGRVFAFYKASRAMLRAKLAIWHLDDRHESEHARWRGQARKYLEFAEREAGKL